MIIIVNIIHDAFYMIFMIFYNFGATCATFVFDMKEYTADIVDYFYMYGNRDLGDMRDLELYSH
eukprot:UN04223